MANHVRFFYLRNAPTAANQKGDPYACVIMRVKPEQNQVEYQFSVCNPKDTFRRDVAHKACLARLEKNARALDYPNVKGATCHDITRAVLGDIANDCDRITSLEPFTVERGAPMRARKGAQEWLDSHGNENIPSEPVTVPTMIAFTETSLPAA